MVLLHISLLFHCATCLSVQDNGISKLKLFSADNDILRALVGHNIEVSSGRDE